MLTNAHTGRALVRAEGNRPGAAPPRAGLLTGSRAVGRPDPWLLGAVLALLVLGVIMVQSASEYVDPLDPTAIVRRQILWVALGALALVVTARVEYHRWRMLAVPGMVGAVALVALVLRVGTSSGGATRWLSFGALLSVQPSEIAKLAFILFAADRLTRFARSGNIPGTERGMTRYSVNIFHTVSSRVDSVFFRVLRRLAVSRYAPVALVALMLVGLVLLQNDLGTVIILAACAAAVCWLAGAPWVPLLAALGGASVLGSLIIAATPFRRARITAFLHPLRCDTATAYHICQSLLALGSGGVLGRGLGAGVQKAGYLPAPYTDSIFAVIGEELGLWGGLLVLALVGVLLWRGMRIARQAPDRFGALLAGGITCWLVVQAILNIGSCVAALPFTGVPLPFVSFGGSSLVVALAAVGIVLNISAQERAGG